MIESAKRLSSLKPYYFAELGRRIASLRETGVDVIRLDIGSPDMPPADFIIESMVQSARRPDTHGYTTYGGTPAFRQAIANYYKNRFGVSLDYRTQIVGLIGSKEGLFTLNQAILNPGDVAIVPDPGYLTYGASAKIAGGEIYTIPLREENSYLPDLTAIPEEILERVKVLWLNYPNNPTGAVAPLGFFEEVISFAKEHQFLVAHDGPYLDICYDGYQAPSILQVPGADEVAVEFNSLSKVYNMAGWRLGMAVGNPHVVQYIETYKNQVDTSHFEPILAGGITALNGDQSWVKERNTVYQKRRDTILADFNQMGLEPLVPKAALYIWTKVPDGTNDFVFCERLLEETGVSTTPGSIYGQCGSGYFRISLCTPLEKIEDAMSRIVNWMEKKDIYGKKIN